MAREPGKSKQGAVPERRGRTVRAPDRPAAAPARRLATSEARAEFSALVNGLAKRDRPSASLADNAVEIGPHRKGGAWLVPEVDAQAAVDRITELEEELENIAIGLLLQERLDESSGGTTPARDVIRELGFDDLLEGLPGELRS
jgi:hypothetical protein